MAYATVANLEAYVNAPVKDAGVDGGLVNDVGAISSEARWTTAEKQAALDAGAAIIAAAFNGIVTIPAASTYARQMNLAWAAAYLLDAEEAEINVQGQRTRAQLFQDKYDKLLEEANKYPSVFGASVASVSYTATEDA